MSKASPRFRRINPPLPPLGPSNVFLVTIGGTADNEEWFVNMGMVGANTLTAASEANIAISTETTMTNSLRGVLDASSEWLTVKVTCLNVRSRMPFTRFVNGGVGFAGVIGATHIPKEMAAVISKVTAVKGQHGRGRNYYPAVPVSFVTPANNPNNLNLAAITAYNAVDTAWFAGTIVDAGTTMEPCVFTTPKTIPGFAPPPVQQVALVTSFIVRAILGTVRRRRPGRGK